VADGLREVVYSVGSDGTQYLTLVQAARHLLRSARDAPAPAEGAAEGARPSAAAASPEGAAAGSSTRKRKPKRAEGGGCSDGDARDAGGGGGGTSAGGTSGAAASGPLALARREELEQPPRKRMKAALLEALAAVGMGTNPSLHPNLNPYPSPSPSPNSNPNPNPNLNQVGMGVPRFKRTGLDAVSGQLRVECRLGDECLAVGSGTDFKAASMAARLQVVAPSLPPPPHTGLKS